MTDWYADLDATLDAVWRTLEHGVADRTSPARHPTLATVGPGGAPEVRTVVLRAAERDSGRLDVHSDVATAKIDEIRAEPRIGVHVWDPHTHLQLRLRGWATILTGEPVAEIWRAVPASARRNYGGAPAPGTPIDDPSAHEPAVESDRFAVVRCTLGEIETLHLGPDRHRRARFRAADQWRGTWLAP